MWQYEFSITTDAAPDQVWRVWSDVKNWSAWDSSVQWCKISEPFSVGSQFQLKPVGGPQSLVKISNCEINKNFTTVSKLPGATMSFEHVITRYSQDLILVTHKIVISGPLNCVFGWLIGKKLAKHLPDVMSKMIEQAKLS